MGQKWHCQTSEVGPQGHLVVEPSCHAVRNPGYVTMHSSQQPDPGPGHQALRWPQAPGYHLTATERQTQSETCPGESSQPLELWEMLIKWLFSFKPHKFRGLAPHLCPCLTLRFPRWKFSDKLTTVCLQPQGGSTNNVRGASIWPCENRNHLEQVKDAASACPWEPQEAPFTRLAGGVWKWGCRRRLCEGDS